MVFIIDMRRNPSPLDLDLKNWLEACDVDYILVGTKADKLSQTELKKQGRKLNDAYFEGEEGELLIYSSKNGRGRKELWSVITALMGK